jgi:hypothetical protein
MNNYQATRQRNSKMPIRTSETGLDLEELRRSGNV